MALSVKEELIKLIQSLPEDISIEDVMYHLYVRETILKRMEDVKNNPSRLLTEDEVENELRKWDL